MTLQESIDNLITSIQINKDAAAAAGLSAARLSKTRSVFRGGREQRITIGNAQDIFDRREKETQLLTEIGEQEQDLALLQEVQIQDLENEQNNSGSLNDLLAAPISFLQTGPGENNNNSLIPILAIGGALLFL